MIYTYILQIAADTATICSSMPQKKTSVSFTISTKIKRLKRAKFLCRLGPGAKILGDHKVSQPRPNRLAMLIFHHRPAPRGPRGSRGPRGPRRQLPRRGQGCDRPSVVPWGCRMAGQRGMGKGNGWGEGRELHGAGSERHLHFWQ